MDFVIFMTGSKGGHLAKDGMWMGQHVGDSACWGLRCAQLITLPLTMLVDLPMPYADPEAQRRYWRERAQKRRAQGLCRSCNTKAARGRSRCRLCEDKEKVNS